jgi:ABC-type transport system substrate-binding protein
MRGTPAATLLVLLLAASLLCFVNTDVPAAHGASGKVPQLVYLALSPSIAPTSIPDFRRAIAYAIDRPAVISAVRPLSPDALILPTSIEDPRLPGYIDASSDVYPYDPGRARQTIEQVGWRSQITIAIGTSSPDRVLKSLSDAVAQSIERSLGVKTEVRAVTPTSTFLLEAKSGAIPLAIVGWVSSENDYGYPSYTLGITHAYSVLRSIPEVAQLLEKNDVAGLQKLLLREAFIVPLVFSYRHQ